MNIPSALFLALLLPAMPLKPPQISAGVHLQRVEFAGVTQLPAADVEKCASQLRSRTYEGAAWLDEVAERALQCWQRKGYFKARLTPEAKQLADRDGTHRFAVTLTVNEGRQYRLGGITFSGTTLTQDRRQLRGLIPLADGAVFNSEQIGQGISHLQKAYSELGFLNMTSAPDTEVNDANDTINIQWDIDEGKQFFVRDVEFDGVSPATADTLRRRCYLKRGDVYNSLLLDKFVRQIPAIAHNIVVADVQVHPDNTSGIVDLRFKLAPRRK